MPATAPNATPSRVSSETDRLIKPATVVAPEPMLKLARRSFNTETQSGRLEIKEGSVSSIPFPDASFTHVTAINTLHFWPDPAGGLREVRRVLRPGGRVVIVLRPKDYLERIRFTRHGFAAYDDQELRDLLAYLCSLR